MIHVYQETESKIAAKDIANEEEDGQIELESIESEERERDVTPLSYDLSIYPADYTLDVLYNKWKKEEIVIPQLQRRYVWSMSRASRLIESFMMGLPVPPVFFFLRPDQKYLVIDGRQRLESIFQFFGGHFGHSDKPGRRAFRLDGINPQNHRLYNKSFEELGEDDQRRLQNTVLRAIIVRQVHPSDDDTSIYHIFERLNTGGVTLTDQQVRNCAYHGKLNDLLVDLNKYENWRRVLGKTAPDPAQKDVGLILRYMSLLHSGSEYKKPMKDFLSQFMSRHKDPPEEFLAEEERRFKTVCDTLVDSLGDRPFNPQGALNPSVFDSIFVAFAKHPDTVPEDIQKKFQRLRENKDFIQYAGSATTDVGVVQKRLKLAEDILFG